ncbi:MAG: inorganic phosphate transporter [Fibrobacterota bacterium]
MYRLFSAFLLGWGLGANDSANVFGTAVASRVIRYSSAVLLSALFILAGAVLQGYEGIETLQSLAPQNSTTAFITSLGAAVSVVILTLLKLPISTSQAVVGAILGVQVFKAIYLNTSTINYAELTKIVVCWIATPVGAFIFTLILYSFFQRLINFFKPQLTTGDRLIKYGLILSGCYGSYALGANNVANVTGIYVGENNILTPLQGVLFGGMSIAAGVLTYSRNVMMTVGRNVIPLDGFSALIAVIAHAAAVHLFAVIGVPVSTSQAIVGAVLAIGFIKNRESIHYKTVLKVFSGWIVTPLIAFCISFGLTLVSNLKLEVYP